MTALLTVVQSTMFAAAAGHPGRLAAALALVLGACLMGVLSWGRAMQEGG
jgi:hypothetical protein